MVAVTQRIDNYLGGVSKQADDKKLPGQVQECLNGYPDPTFGLTKRPGFKWIANLGTGTTYDTSKWFYIARTATERYIGCIKPKPGSGYGDIDVWNVDGTVCNVAMDTSTAVNAVNYLTGSKVNYDVISVQENTIITNNLFSVTAQAAPSFTANSKATLVLSGSSFSITYTVTIAGQSTSITSGSSDAYDTVLTNLKTAIDNLSTTHSFGLTVTKHNASIQITRATAFTITAKGGPNNDALTYFQDQVDNVSQLPAQSVHDHTVKVINTSSANDSYWAKFVADNSTSGTGYWSETRDPTVSPGLDASTMPHQLVNTSTNNFTFKQITYTNRLVGDDTTNEHPSFVGNKIQQAFFHGNRLGFLSEDNVILSQSAKFYNFYFTSAQTITDADPVDMTAATIRPAALHAVVPTTQGLVLFSKNQQFMMFSADGILTPSTTIVRAISNYEVDTDVDPVDIGTKINFLSKTPNYTRIFGMMTRGQDENPTVLDIGRIVNEWVPANIDTFISSPQNEFIAMSSQSSNKIYFYRTYSDGEKNLVESWFNWQLMGTVQSMVVDSDDMFVVTKQGTQFTLSKASLSQSPDDAIIVNNEGQKINPCIDLYAPASSVKYNPVDAVTITNGGSGYSSAPTVTIAGKVGVNSGTPGSGATATATVSGGAVTAVTITAGGSGYSNGATVTFSGGGGANAAATITIYDGSKAYIPWSQTSGLTPVLIVKGTTATGQFIDSGFTITPKVGNDGADYFSIPRRDFSGIAADVIVGWKYDLDVILPKVYYRVDEQKSRTDFTANLTIARMKFAVGLSGVMAFKLKTTGVRQGSRSYTADGVTTTFEWIDDDLAYIDSDQVKVKINGIESTAFTILENKITLSAASSELKSLTGNGSTKSFDLTFTPTDPSKIKVTVNGIAKTVGTDYNIVNNYINFTTAPGNTLPILVYSADDILIYLDEWYNLNPVIMANTYLANDIALKDQSVFTLPIHQKSDNFELRIFNDSPFPVSLNSMMWEGNYSPRFYSRR